MPQIHKELIQFNSKKKKKFPQYIRSCEQQTNTVLEGKFKALAAYIRKEKRFQIGDLSVYIKKLEKNSK